MTSILIILYPFFFGRQDYFVSIVER